MAKIEGFITNLGKYNEGKLIGKWIEFPIDEDELNEALKEIGCKYTDENGKVYNELYEEFFFSDWECEIPLKFGEYESISDVNDIAERVENLMDYEQDVLKVILEEHTSDVDEALRIVEGGNYVIWSGESMKTVKKIKQVLEHIFLAIGTYFGICVICAG